MKILKDAGAVPPEIALLQVRARLRASLEAAVDPGERGKSRAWLSLLEQLLTLRLESLRNYSNS